MRMRTVAVLFCGYVAYVILGGGIFHYIESEIENQTARPPEEVFDLSEILEGQADEYLATTHATHLHSQAVSRAGGTVHISHEETLSPAVRQHNITAMDGGHVSCGHQGLSAVLESFREKVRRVDGIIADLHKDMDDTDRCVRTSDIPLVILSYKELESIVRRAAQAGKEGVDPVTGQQEQTRRKWDFQASLGFALTVVTTMGYGHIAPASAVGKAICVLYALFGIPFTAVLVTNVAHHVGDQIRKAALKYHRVWRLCCRTASGSDVLARLHHTDLHLDPLRDRIPGNDIRAHLFRD
ncbi:KCNK10 [Branchiostoma lanceolatum]|uniref:KCNK10 protein n=1 Tax=Branchiostoma lanceolatum TaxID=7740 RepID=A0A8J9ZRV4_BRALA|nr:KCNK10 [Branchiostoma lanceolatum]